MESMYNSRQTAQKLGISMGTLLNWVKTKKISYVLVGSRYRFTQSIINRILTPHNVEESLE